MCRVWSGVVVTHGINELPLQSIWSPNTLGLGCNLSGYSQEYLAQYLSNDSYVDDGMTSKVGHLMETVKSTRHVMVMVKHGH